MVEIVFSDSACGSLKAAQSCGKEELLDVYVHIIANDDSELTQEEMEALRQEAEERQRQAWEKATPLGGDPADVYGFALFQSIGDISEDIPGVKRRRALDWLFSIYPHEDDEEMPISDALTRALKPALNEILSRAAAGEALRIWYSDQPDELCGMFWFMTQLTQLEAYGDVYLVKLPEWDSNEQGNITLKSSWGEVAPEEWHHFSELQRLAPPIFCQYCADRWRALQKENAPLRALLNGKLVSVPETLYDSFITAEIAAVDREFYEANVIGRILGKYELGIGDAWVALRIEEMIQSGLLEPVSEADKDAPIYHRYLRKRGES